VADSVSIPDAEEVSRTALLVVNRDEAGSFAEAQALLDAEEIIIVAGSECATSAAHQAALLTAANTARRAVGVVTLIASRGVLDAPVLVGSMRHSTLQEALTRLRTTIADTANGSDGPAVLIGSGPDVAGLRVTWVGWTAAVFTTDRRLAEDDAMPLAPIAAAALAVSETFQALRGHPEATARDIMLSLWNPTTSAPLDDVGPGVTAFPNEWFLVGLGHLGQAYGWCLTLLRFAEPERVFIQLQDRDYVTGATLSTGLLTFPDAGKRRKTRVVADELDAAGFTTVIVERLLRVGDRLRDDEPQLALIGVDNVAARRGLSEFGWNLCIDAGLGSGVASYTRIRLQAFPGPQASNEVPAWNREPSRRDDLPSARAYVHAQPTDECGLITLAGKAVAVTFVGAIAACFAIAEPIRALYAGSRLAVQTVDLATGRVRGDSMNNGAAWSPPSLSRLRAG
jgi:hypothetical protein